MSIAVASLTALEETSRRHELVDQVDALLNAGVPNLAIMHVLVSHLATVDGREYRDTVTALRALARPGIARR